MSYDSLVDLRMKKINKQKSADTVLQVNACRDDSYEYVHRETDLHKHRYPLVCWQSCGKVRAQPEELPGWSRWPRLYLWITNISYSSSSITKEEDLQCP